ncbi:MFS transporter [Actinomadura sp. DC4]|uniref:MFS transporter n=1 Tax=Actinomadura sp. DC4 TaxID=3055069 RepID=UPI0025B006E6|nr:MFS transporter [Actinomadura sp. DC4]MDN3358574.1 MFS transporter [Actinomadura sp. DC4]
MAEPATGTRPDGVWHGRGDFARLWVGQVLSSVGSRASGTAFVLLVLAETHSPVMAGVAGAFATGGFLLAHVFGGSLADRHSRRTVMITCDLVSTGTLVVFAATLLTGGLVFPVALGMCLVDGLVYGVFTVTEAAAVSVIAEGDRLPRALMLNQARSYTAGLSGPPLGGFLLGLGRVVPFAADAVSHVVSLALIRRIRSPLGRPDRTGGLDRRALTQGWRNVLSNPFIRLTGGFVATTDFLINALRLVVIVLAQRAGASPVEVGLLFACGSTGGMLGAFAAARTRTRPSALRVFVIAVPLGTAVLFGLLSVSRGVAIGVVYALVFAAWPLWQGLVTARWMTLVPDGERARTFAAVRLMTSTPSLFAEITGGWLVVQAGPQRACLILGVAMALVGLAAALPASRRVLSAYAG